VFCAAVLLCALYFGDLNGMGLISTDEPRYADIGRAMARTGDLITPRLWGQPWFEKPPLLYWAIAAGFRAGLGPELAPRLPVALLSVLFLLFYWDRLRRMWDTRVACCSTAILATTAGWVALSGIAITDIPLAVFFSAAVLLAIDEKPRRTASAAALALAVLAKSLVGPVLFLPVLAADYRRIREWLRPGPLIAFFALSLPWYLLCYARNGERFLWVLFVQQQFGRFTSPERQHEQPWWFYFPALLLVLYPWFPLLAVASRNWRDRRIRTLIAVVVFGFLFFSASRNKLPGYVLPLVPSACALMGVGAARLGKPQQIVILPLALIGMVPIALRILPAALANGIHRAAISRQDAGIGVASIAAMAVIGWAMAVTLKTRAPAVAFFLTAAAFLWLKVKAYPALDGAATARPVWEAMHPPCIESAERRFAYGLNYYAARELPRCAVLDQGPARVVR
jgi:4-amino-4-deoxy-L-arabinose transferase-like glycosyltransferase